MGDHRASIKIEMEFHDVKKTCDMWVNYYPNGCCGMDQRVIDFFDEVYNLGMANYNAMVAKIEYENDRAAREKREVAELKRLKSIYEPVREKGEGE